VQERLDKVAQLVLASTVREVVAVLKEKEEGKTARSVGAVIGHVGSAVRRSAEWLIV
jgi:response regulator of citrate/malate metabolism